MKCEARAQEITEELEAKLLEEQGSYAALAAERDALSREAAELKRQLEEDADRCAAPSQIFPVKYVCQIGRCDLTRDSAALNLSLRPAGMPRFAFQEDVAL